MLALLETEPVAVSDALAEREPLALIEAEGETLLLAVMLPEGVPVPLPVCSEKQRRGARASSPRRHGREWEQEGGSPRSVVA